LIEGRIDALQTDQVLASPEDGVSAELGQALADHLGVELGSKLSISLPGLLEGRVPIKVVGIVRRGMHDLDSRMLQIHDGELRAYLQANAPQAWTSRPGDAHGVRFFFDSSWDKPSDYTRLESWMEAYQNAVNDADPQWSFHRVLGWRDQESSLFASIAHDRRQLAMILSFLTLVAALNVAATMVVLFLERDREMSMLQAIGLTPAQLRFWISTQGLFLGLASSSLGVVLGGVFGWVLVRLPFAQLPPEIYNLSHLDLGYDWREQLAVFGFGVLASVVTAFLISLSLSQSRLLHVLGSRR
jgi:ABC-type lipoprotein release transport system permease subunit